MKIILRTSLLATLLALGGIAQAEWSANLGFASEYYYRGIFQESTSASGGIDYKANGLFVGTWVADVGDGLEVDGYFGYGGRAGDFGYSIGFTGYYYTGDFDDTYQEINFGANYGLFSADVAVGQYSNFDGPTLDYIYFSLTAEKNGLYGKLGGFTRDFAGNYLEAGYGTNAADFDVGIALIFSNSDLVGENDAAIVFTIGKPFDLQ